MENERTVVVTGASGGVGRAVACAFAARGDRVALLARGRSGLLAAAEDVRERGGTALPVPVDVADDRAVEEAAQQVEEQLGPIDVWVNNAFAGAFASVLDTEAAEYRRVTEVTYLGYVHGTRAALRRMLPRDRGTIVQVGSALAYRGVPLQSAYCAAKHAIQGFNESLRCELLHEGSRVRTTMVQLPAVNTPQFGWVLSRLPGRPRPVAPVYQPEVAARAIVYAADHPRRREYWTGASTVATLVVNAVAPALIERYLARTGFASQQDPGEPHLAHNLFTPLDDAKPAEDPGAHGRFDAEAKSASPQGWLSRHRTVLTLAAGGAALGARAAYDRASGRGSGRRG